MGRKPITDIGVVEEIKYLVQNAEEGAGEVVLASGSYTLELELRCI